MFCVLLMNSIFWGKGKKRGGGNRPTMNLKINKKNWKIGRQIEAKCTYVNNESNSTNPKVE